MCEVQECDVDSASYSAASGSVWGWPVSKHTPGPWDIHVGNLGADARGQQQMVMICSEDMRIATMFSVQDRDANARLIAAAPELLEACKAAMRLDYFREHSALALQVQAAIKKAEGAQ